MTRVVLYGLLALPACSVTPRRPDPAPVCRIGLLRHGTDPARPYRVLGDVQADDEAISTREQKLERDACKLGAQAVIDVREVLEPNGNNFGRAESDKSWPGGNEGRPATAGTAVVFTDGKGAPQPQATPVVYTFPR